MQNDGPEGKEETQNMLDPASIGPLTPQALPLLGVLGVWWTVCVGWWSASNDRRTRPAYS